MKKGFSSIEIFLIIISIFFILTLILPPGIDFYKKQQLQAYSQQILQTIRKAQLKAESSEGESDFGVYFDNINKKYILFKGNSYIPGNPNNEEFDFPDIITIRGPLEVVFLTPEGTPKSPIGDVVIHSNGLGQTININEKGRINLEI